MSWDIDVKCEDDYLGWQWTADGLLREELVSPVAVTMHVSK